jgi:hypothetical protein
MVKLDDAARVRLWVALGTQPGLSAGYAVWLLARLWPPARQEASKPAPAAVAASRPIRRVRAGTHAHQEQPRP